jgi:MFS family permease
MVCPFCGGEDWHGWEERVALEHVAGSTTVDRGTEAFRSPVRIAAAVGFGLVSTLGFSLFAALIPRGEAGGYTALYYSLRAAASALAVPLAGLTIAASGSYRSLFLLGGTATLAALVPLSLSPSPEEGARLTRELP